MWLYRHGLGHGHGRKCHRARGRMHMSMSKEGTTETDSNPKFSAKFKTLGRIKELKGLLGPAVACLR